MTDPTISQDAMMDRVTLTGPTYPIIKCPACGGAGGSLDEVCSTCLGTGRMVSTEATRISAGEAGEMVADSGMSGEAVERAEWAWANLPVGPRKWTSLATHEKALVCHVITRISATDTEAMRLLMEARMYVHNETLNTPKEWSTRSHDLLARIDALAKGGV